MQSERLLEVNENIDNINEEINAPFNEQEIIKAVKSLKNNKATGGDNILNEHIKTTLHIMLPVYVKLFNAILKSGYIPQSWTEGIIKPIYKNKGDQNKPENYRPISLLSCLGKLFTCVLKNRLNIYAENRT